MDSNTEQTNVNPIVPNDVQQSLTHIETKKKSWLGLYISVFILFFLIGLFTYLLTFHKDEIPFLNKDTEIEERNDDQEVVTNDEDITEEKKEEEEEEEVVIVEQKEYINDNFGVRLSYPKDWVIIEETEEGDMALTVRIGKSKDATTNIFLYQVMPTSIDKCVYSESALTVTEGQSLEVYYDNYVSIGSDDQYRRSFAKYGEVDSYLVCRKTDEEYTFKRGGPEFITYHNVDENDVGALAILDDILLSYEYFGDVSSKW